MPNNRVIVTNFTKTFFEKMAFLITKKPIPRREKKCENFFLKHSSSRVSKKNLQKTRKILVEKTKQLTSRNICFKLVLAGCGN